MKKRRLSKSKEVNITVIQVANYIIENNATIRNAAKKFNLSKSTIYNYMIKRLPTIDIDLYNQIKILFAIHRAEGRIKGTEKSAQVRRAQKK